jgi:hypothetical protein
MFGGSGSKVRVVALTAFAGASLFAGAAAPGVAAREREPRVLLVGTWQGHHGQFSSIQAAVNAARSGDWVLVAPGDYHEQGDRDPRYSSLARVGAGVMITTPGIHVRGLDRNGVVIDGTLPGSPKCSSDPSRQDLGPLDSAGHPRGRNGIEVYKADNVTIENITACNFLNGAGSTGNQIWFNGGDGSGTIGMHRYYAAYLNATSTFYKDASSPQATYGIFTSNDGGPGLITHTYASNMNDASYYIGACPDCNQVLTDSHAQYSALGFSGTNAGGHLIVQNTEWDHNKTGIVTNSQNNDDAPSPQIGLCPGSTTLSCTIYRDNYVHDNNNPNVPNAGSAALGPPGGGILLSGGRNDKVVHNRVENNGSWGILIVPFPDSTTPPVGPGGPPSQCQGGIVNYLNLFPCYFDAWGNEVAFNQMKGNGSFGNQTNGDLAEISNQHDPGNCWHGNTDPGGVTSAPANLQTTHATCGVPNAGASLGDPLTAQVICATEAFGPCPSNTPGMMYPRTTHVVMPPLPGGLRSMDDACDGLPENAFCDNQSGNHNRAQ